MSNSCVNALLTDNYQLSMAYAYWKSNRHNDHSTFELFFRKAPFKGEYAIFAGLSEALTFVQNFRFTRDHTQYLSSTHMSDCEDEFFSWLLGLDCSAVTIYAIPEGTVVFPFLPLLRLEGPLAVCQLLETTLLNLLGFATLVCTNACRMVRAAGPGKVLLDFGLRRAQGPDGGLSASRYTYLGGFHGTSNVLAGKMFGIPVKGTHAHSFVASYIDLSQLSRTSITQSSGQEYPKFVDDVLAVRKELDYTHSHEGELAAFISYAQTYPKGFLALVDTYNTLQSGVPNFLCVSIVLSRMGYLPIGIRLDSGDLSELSKEVRNLFVDIGTRMNLPWMRSLKISASNDINEEALLQLANKGHEIDMFGIGTHLVTCQAQPALGVVYKLVEVNGVPRIKISHDRDKILLPGRKEVARFCNKEGTPIMDVICSVSAEKPGPGGSWTVFEWRTDVKETIEPHQVHILHRPVWSNGRAEPLPSLHQCREYVYHQMKKFPSSLFQPVGAQSYRLRVDSTVAATLHRLLSGATWQWDTHHSPVSISPKSPPLNKSRNNLDNKSESFRTISKILPHMEGENDLRQLFDKYDTNKSGLIERPEMEKIFKFHSIITVDNREFDRLLRRFRWNDQDGFDYQRFEILMLHLMQL